MSAKEATEAINHIVTLARELNEEVQVRNSEDDVMQLITSGFRDAVLAAADQAYVELGEVSDHVL